MTSAISRNCLLFETKFREIARIKNIYLLLDRIYPRSIVLLFPYSDEDSGTNIKFTDWPVNSIIVSAQFWPPFKSETLELPKEITQGLEAYKKAFEGMYITRIYYCVFSVLYMEFTHRNLCNMSINFTLSFSK